MYICVFCPDWLNNSLFLVKLVIEISSAVMNVPIKLESNHIRAPFGNSVFIQVVNFSVV